MIEQQFAHRIRQALDGSLERLPFRVTQRLASARRSAVARARPLATVAGPASALGLLTADGTASLAGPDFETPPLFWRLTITVLPLIVVALGIFSISQWETWHRADDIADIDVAVLIDEVPISAYADLGFGVFLKNTNQ